MAQKQKPCSRIIAAPDRSQLGQSSKAPESAQTFNLFDNFTFSNTNYETAYVSNYSTNPVKNESEKNNWEEVSNRFSNLNLQVAKISPTDSKDHSQAPDVVPRGRCVVSYKSQQFVVPDRFYQGVPSGVQFMYGNYPGYYFIPPPGPFVDPRALRNLQFPTISTSAQYRSQAEYQYPNASCRSECCNFNYCMNANIYQETVPAIEFEKPEFQEFNKKNYKPKPAGKPVKPLKKVAFPKYSRRRNFMQENTDENDICFPTAPNPIPKGARPILSSRK